MIKCPPVPSTSNNCTAGGGVKELLSTVPAGFLGSIPETSVKFDIQLRIFCKICLSAGFPLVACSNDPEDVLYFCGTYDTILLQYTIKTKELQANDT